MKTTQLALAALLFTSLAHADPRLVGVWEAANAEKGALTGSLTFLKGGAAELHPKGFPAAPGSWKVSNAKKRVLTVTLKDVGSSDMTYTFNNEQLVLTYDNGNQQKFVRKPSPKTK